MISQAANSPCALAVPEVLLEMEQVRLCIFALTGCYHALVTKSRGKTNGEERGRLNYAVVSVNYSLKC